MNAEIKDTVLKNLNRMEARAKEDYDGALHYKNFRRAEECMHRMDACFNVAKMVNTLEVRPGEAALQRSKDAFTLNLAQHCLSITPDNIRYIETAKVLSEVLEMLLEN